MYEDHQSPMDEEAMKNTLCASCTHKRGLAKGRSYCSQNQIFFGTKKAESCKQYIPIVKSNILILPPHEKKPEYTLPTIPPPQPIWKQPKYKIVENEFEYVKMVG